MNFLKCWRMRHELRGGWFCGALRFAPGMDCGRRVRAKRHIVEKSIEPDALYVLLETSEVLLYDVRQPLDFLAYPEIIPGAMRIARRTSQSRRRRFPATNIP